MAVTLEVRDATVSFGGNVVLRGVNLDAQPGRITALIGPNGAGKTTLFNVIAGVQRPTGGSVRLNGIDVTGMAPHRRVHAGLGRTFQRLELFGSLSVAENLRVAASSLPRSERRSKVDEVIDRLNLGDLADTRADTLSTGTGRMVELARVLVGNPTVLLLDEPASGQDDNETARFAQILSDLASDGLTVLLVEHDMGLVMSISDHVHVLDFGKVIASGTCDQIKADPEVQAAYLGVEVPQ
ncbi:MAG: ABC transporter ATP-binding protein [Microthrixaceae bacterium]|nr:ABC transporter ATP-binding protein [Microthrixaceae bacterium]